MRLSSPRRRRWPFRLLVVVVVLVALAVGADFAARYAVQDAIASKVKKATKAGSVSASIRSFPFIYDVGAEGRVDGVDIVAHNVPAGPVTLTTVELSTSDVRLDRSQLIPRSNERTVPVRAVARATLTVRIDLTGIERDLARAGVTVSTAGSSSLVVSVDGVALDTIHLTNVPIIPSCPLQTTHTATTYTFSCTVSPVPQSVIDALSGRA